MADDSRALWCTMYTISYQSQPFEVIAPIHSDIYELKELIYDNIKNRFRDINAQDLDLWKVVHSTVQTSAKNVLDDAFSSQLNNAEPVKPQLLSRNAQGSGSLTFRTLRRGWT
jgi:Crinkler effector protein N-terminal domain